MKCLICNATFSDDVLRLRYQVYHSINENIYLFRELFSPDNLSKRCDECKLEFKNCRLKKKIIIFFSTTINFEAAGTSNYHSMVLDVVRYFITILIFIKIIMTRKLLRIFQILSMNVLFLVKILRFRDMWRL